MGWWKNEDDTVDMYRYLYKCEYKYNSLSFVCFVIIQIRPNVKMDTYKFFSAQKMMEPYTSWSSLPKAESHAETVNLRRRPSNCCLIWTCCGAYVEGGYSSVQPGKAPLFFLGAFVMFCFFKSLYQPWCHYVQICNLSKENWSMNLSTRCEWWP